MKLKPLLRLIGLGAALLFTMANARAQGTTGCLPMINPSFEVDTFTVLPGYALNGNGPITGWSSPNNSGVNPVAGVPVAAANPFSDNGTIPHGSQVAFMQHDFSMM